MNLQKEHGKTYADKPKILTFVCEHCGKRYIHEFKYSEFPILWEKELKDEVKCSHCNKPRL